jgi:4-hydroxythreonine-4-phosphate dehydrogenase
MSHASITRNAERPLVALTLGDVAGIGPEVAVRAALDEGVRSRVRPLLVGHPEIVRRALRLLTSTATLKVVREPANAGDSDAVECWQVGSDDAVQVAEATVDARAGRAAYDCLIAAIDAALAGTIGAIVTAPLNKLALRAAGVGSPGHTEILAERCGVAQHAMLLHLPQGGPIRQEFGLSVAHVTLHTSIASVPGLLSREAIVGTARLVDGFVRQLGATAPRVGVCALNPHAGESGLFGDEESRWIAPAVAEACAAGLDARGPFPADTLFKRGVVDQEFDGIVAMYHDQGHIAFKLIGFERAVNVTLGLPIVRTSPSHGTAFDIAWRGIARAEGMIAAVTTAARLVRSRGCG